MISTISRGVSSAIFSLSQEGKGFGTRYDVQVGESCITLQLTDVSGSVIKELHTHNSNLVDIITDLEKQVLELQ